MRILPIITIMVTVVACAERPTMAPHVSAQPSSVKTSSTSESVQQSSSIDNDSFTEVDTPATPEQAEAKAEEVVSAAQIEDMMPAAPAPTAATPAAPAPVAAKPAIDAEMQAKVMSMFVDNPKINPAKAQVLGETSMALIQAANAGDKTAVRGMSVKMIKQAIFSQGLGKIDFAAAILAVADCVKAVVNADLLGIVKAITDFIAAIT